MYKIRSHVANKKTTLENILREEKFSEKGWSVTIETSSEKKEKGEIYL